MSREGVTASGRRGRWEACGVFGVRWGSFKTYISEKKKCVFSRIRSLALVRSSCLRLMNKKETIRGRGGWGMVFRVAWLARGESATSNTSVVETPRKLQIVRVNGGRVPINHDISTHLCT